MGLKNLGDEGRILGNTAVEAERPPDVGVEACPDIIPVFRTGYLNGAVSVVSVVRNTGVVAEIAGDLLTRHSALGRNSDSGDSISIDNRDGYVQCFVADVDNVTVEFACVCRARVEGDAVVLILCRVAGSGSGQ